jgi:hypothetical protein
VIFALIPFAINGYHLYTHAAGRSIFWYELWPRGELLLVSVAVGSDAVGELFGSGTRWAILKAAGGGICIVLAVCAAGFFSDSQFSAAPDPARISTVSMVVFVCIFVSGMTCKVLAEIK